jgi:hypothetical protein
MNILNEFKNKNDVKADRLKILENVDETYVLEINLNFDNRALIRGWKSLNKNFICEYELYEEYGKAYDIFYQTNSVRSLKNKLKKI